MKEKLIEDIESLKQAAKFMRITNDITPTGLNALHMGLDALIEVVKNISSKQVVTRSLSHIAIVKWITANGFEIENSREYTYRKNENIYHIDQLIKLAEAELLCDNDA